MLPLKRNCVRMLTVHKLGTGPHALGVWCLADCVCLNRKARTEFSEDHVKKLEKWIDEMDDDLPPLTAFILPVSVSVSQGPLYCGHHSVRIHFNGFFDII